MHVSLINFFIIVKLWAITEIFNVTCDPLLLGIECNIFEMGIWIEEKHIPPSYFVPSLIRFCSIFMFMLKKVMSWGIWGTFENCWVLSFKNSEHRCGTVFCVKQYMYLDGCMYKKLWNNIQCGNVFSRRVKHYWPFIWFISYKNEIIFIFIYSEKYACLWRLWIWCQNEFEYMVVHFC